MEDINVSLAIIEKNLKEINEKQTLMSITLYGNGKVEDSVIWVLKELSSDVKQVNESVKELTDIVHKLPCKAGKSCDTWSDVLKKVCVKAPYAIAAIVAIILLHQPAATLVVSLVKMLGLIVL